VNISNSGSSEVPAIAIDLCNIDGFISNITPLSKQQKIKINRISHVLLEKEVSQKELAERIGKTATMISYYCNNTTQPPLNVLYDIAIALKVNIKDLLYDTPGE